MTSFRFDRQGCTEGDGSEPALRARLDALDRLRVRVPEERLDVTLSPPLEERAELRLSLFREVREVLRGLADVIVGGLPIISSSSSASGMYPGPFARVPAQT